MGRSVRSDGSSDPSDGVFRRRLRKRAGQIALLDRRDEAFYADSAETILSVLLAADTSLGM